MSTDARLAPDVQTLLPVPRFRNSIVPLPIPIHSMPSRDLGDVVSPLLNDYPKTGYARTKPNPPPSHLNGSLGQPSDSMSNLGYDLDRTRAANNPLIALAESNAPLQTTRLPLKREFQFIEIHEASGKADSAAGSNLRSHLMRKYHEHRRQTQKARPKRSKTKGCQHFEVFLMPQHHWPVPDPASGSRAASEAAVGNAQFSYGLPSDLQIASETMHIGTQPPSPRQNRSFELEITSAARFVCVQCGELMLHTSSNEEPTELRPLRGSPRSLLSSSSHDPFDSLAIPVTHHMHLMIHHFIFDHALKTNPAIYQKDGISSLLNLLDISSILQDATCIHAMVATSIYQVALLRLRNSASFDLKAKEEAERMTNAASHHSMKAVSLLNKTFENPKKSFSTAALICATLLVSTTAYSGDEDQLSTHHNGIVKMVQIRGGIDTIPRGLAFQIVRCDSGSAWRKKEKPQLPMYSSRFLAKRFRVSAADIMNPVPGVYLDDSRNLSPFPNNKFETFLCENLFSIACNLDALTYALDLTSRQPSKMGPLQREFFEDAYIATQHAITLFARPNEAGIIQSPLYFRQHSWRVAAMAYVWTCLRTWDIASSPIKSMISELIFSLKQSDLHSMSSEYPEVLLWVLFIGASAAWDKVDRGWILTELKLVIEHLCLRSVSEVEGLLKSLIYPESTLGEALKVIWGEIYT